MGKKIYYGWWIVLVAFLSIAVTYGTKGVFGVVQMQMLEDLHWSRASIAGAMSANMLVYALAAPFVGQYMDKVGIKRILMLGGFLTGAAFLLVTTTTSPWEFYLYYGLLLGLANTGMGMVPGPTAVSRWFVKKRGRALSAALVASPLGMAIFTFAAKDLLGTIGWKGLFVIMGLASWLLVILPAYLWMRSTPEEMGLLPDGETGNEAASPTATTHPATAATVQEEEWSLSKLMSSPKALCLLFGYFAMAANGWTQQIHQVPHFIQMGLRKDAATLALGMNMSLSVVSMLLLPTLSDFMKRHHAVAISLALQALGTYLLTQADTLDMVYCFVGVMGISYLGSYGLFSALAADTFGRKSLGTVSGVMAMLGAGGAAVGIYAGGALYDMLGSYNLLWNTGTALLLVGAGLSLLLGQLTNKTTPRSTTTR